MYKDHYPMDFLNKSSSGDPQKPRKELASKEAERELDEITYEILKFEVEKLVDFFCQETAKFYEKSLGEAPAPQKDLPERVRILKDLKEDYAPPGAVSVWINKVTKEKAQSRGERLVDDKGRYSTLRGEIFHVFLSYINRMEPSYPLLVVDELQRLFDLQPAHFERQIEEVFELEAEEFYRNLGEQKEKFRREEDHFWYIPKSK